MKFVNVCISLNRMPLGRRGAGRGILLRDSVPFVGTWPERARQRPGSRVLPEGRRFPPGHDGAGARGRGPAEPPPVQGAGLPHALRGLPRGAVPVLILPVWTGLRAAPAGLASGLAMPPGTVYNAGKLGLSPLRGRTNTPLP